MGLVADDQIGLGAASQLGPPMGIHRCPGVVIRLEERLPGDVSHMTIRVSGHNAQLLRAWLAQHGPGGFDTYIDNRAM